MNKKNLFVHGAPKYTKLALSYGSWSRCPHVDVFGKRQMNMLLK